MILKRHHHAGISMFTRAPAARPRSPSKVQARHHHRRGSGRGSSPGPDRTMSGRAAQRRGQDPETARNIAGDRRSDQRRASIRRAVSQAVEPACARGWPVAWYERSADGRGDRAHRARGPVEACRCTLGGCGRSFSSRHRLRTHRCAGAGIRGSFCPHPSSNRHHRRRPGQTGR